MSFIQDHVKDFQWKHLLHEIGEKIRDNKNLDAPTQERFQKVEKTYQFPLGYLSKFPLKFPISSKGRLKSYCEDEWKLFVTVHKECKEEIQCRDGKRGQHEIKNAAVKDAEILYDGFFNDSSIDVLEDVVKMYERPHDAPMTFSKRLGGGNQVVTTRLWCTVTTKVSMVWAKEATVRILKVTIKGNPNHLTVIVTVPLDK
ncbi:hypothetical protein BC832DRAFT_542577 [Gaertneriomyces semiglobifer]|nr:hypothetical protein BC832DRAFT_542577 [Gaertneriomyces semiglobifer]